MTQQLSEIADQFVGGRVYYDHRSRTIRSFETRTLGIVLLTEDGAEIPCGPQPWVTESEGGYYVNDRDVVLYPKQ